MHRDLGGLFGLPPGFSSETTNHAAMPKSQLALLKFHLSTSAMMTPTMPSSRCEMCHELTLRSTLVHIPCYIFRPQISMTEWMRYVHVVQWIFVKSLVKTIISVVLCVVILAAKNSDAEMFSCYLERRSMSITWRQWCSTVAVPRERSRPCQCGWNGSNVSPFPVECTLCTHAIFDNTNVQIAYCQQHLQIDCLVRISPTLHVRTWTHNLPVKV